MRQSYSYRPRAQNCGKAQSAQGLATRAIGQTIRWALAIRYSQMANFAAPRHRRILMSGCTPEASAVKILLVDDHPLFRGGLKYLLQSLNEHLELDEAGNCAQAEALATQRAYD